MRLILSAMLSSFVVDRLSGLRHLFNVQVVCLQDGMAAQILKYGLGYCSGGLHGVWASRFGCTARVSNAQATTDPARGRVPRPRCAVGLVACQRYSDCAL